MGVCLSRQHLSLAADLAAQSPRAHVLDQYLNPGNPLSHYDGTAEEMLRQTRGHVSEQGCAVVCARKCALAASTGRPCSYFILEK